MDASVSQWIDRLKAGDQEAARKLWERYFDRLTRAAQRRLGRAPKRTRDEEDVAVSVFESLCLGAAAGRFDGLSDRDELWRLLLRITQQKAVDYIRHETRQKRGGGDVRGESVFVGSEAAHIGNFTDDEPDPQFLIMLEEQTQKLLDNLRDETVRKVAVLRMEGYSNEEIAQELGISLRSVERKLALIRASWSQELQDAD